MHHNTERCFFQTIESATNADRYGMPSTQRKPLHNEIPFHFMHVMTMKTEEYLTGQFFAANALPNDWR
jgi:hypothetical protein